MGLMNEMNEEERKKDYLEDDFLPKRDDRILTTSSLLQVGEHYYQVKPLLCLNFKIDKLANEFSNEFKLADGLKLDPSVAYLMGPYYYLFRGKLSDIKAFDIIEPGIYYDDDKCVYVIKEPETEEEQEKYQYSDKITRFDADAIRDAVANKKVIICNTPDSSHSTIPPETVDDDILKKLIKRAIFAKGIDLDQYKVRFASKNMLFNTKQVLRGPNRLSVLLFDRCAEALNLKYTIILEEGGGEIIGHPLDGKIIISSQDTFDANMKND